MLKDYHIRLKEQELVHVIELVFEGQNAAAIQYIIEHSHYTLKEAKDIVDFIDHPDQDIDLLLPIEGFTVDEAHSSSTSIEYKTIQLNHATGEAFVIYQNGQKHKIDENHPEWHQITQFFYRKDYATVQALIASEKTDFIPLHQNDGAKSDSLTTNVYQQNLKQTRSGIEMVENQPYKFKQMILIVLFLMFLFVLLWSFSSHYF